MIGIADARGQCAGCDKRWQEDQAEKRLGIGEHPRHMMIERSNVAHV